MQSETKARIRCFVAIDTPQSLKEQVSELINNMRSSEGGRKVKWVRPDGVHSTLKFLGDIPAERLPELNTALSEALHGWNEPNTFELSLGGLGSFGKPDAPRVIWLGIGGNRLLLSRLQQVVEKTLNPLGFPPEDRNYSPHLTLGRVPELNREELAAISRLLARYKDLPEVRFGSFSVSEAVLMESDRQPTGAVYTPIAHYSF